MTPEDLLMRLPRWVGPWTRWSAAWANRGPWWLPRWLRLVPLRLAVLVVRAYAWGRP